MFRFKQIILAVGLGLVVCSHAAYARRPIVKIKVQGELRAELNAVLKATVDLQESSFKGQDPKMAIAMKTLIQRIDSASAKSHLANEQQPHILKILQAARTALEKSRRTGGRDRNTFLQKAFSQLVIVSQMYQLDSYKLFFCPKDKSTWLQRGAKPQNPVNPETFGDCGKLVL